jgi:hypothetical protein
MEPQFKAYYPFLREDVRLGAWVFSNGRQVLRMEQLDIESQKIIRFDELDCIHTAVQDIPVEEFNDENIDQEFVDNMLQTRSSEEIRVIHLAPEEKFKAFNSWVAGIAEAGMEAFELQTEIEIANRFAYPITDKLLRFMIHVDPKFIPTYLVKTEQAAFFNGIRHDAYMISKLLPVCNMLFMDMIQHQGLTEMGKKVLAMLIEIRPPEELFVKNLNYGFLLMHQWKYYSNLLQHHPDMPTQLMLLLISYGAHREYMDFSIFSDDDRHNPILIVLNQFLSNIDIQHQIQRNLLLQHVEGCEKALNQVQKHLTEEEYTKLITKVSIWKAAVFR